MTANPILKKVKNFVMLIGVLSLGYIIIYMIASFFGERENDRIAKIKENEKTTKCKIIKVGNMKGSYAVAEYHVQNLRFERKASSPSDYTYVGENYEIMYDSLQPTESKILFNKPFFYNYQKTSIATGYINDVDGYTIKYAFRVSGELYGKFQAHGLNTAPILNKASYEVEYLVNNPNISILKWQ